jgi:N-acetylglucosamine-6-phosphate deacetylase
MSVTKPEFFFDGMAVGYFEEVEPPRSSGRYRYMLYRGPGHCEMQAYRCLKGSPRCYYAADNHRVSFTVSDCPEYGVLELCDFDISPFIVVARHYETGRWVGLALEEGLKISLTAVDGPEEISDSDDWVAPAFWDLQINGRLGVSFSDPTLTVDQVAAIVRAQAGLGTARLCPTLITAPELDMLHGVRTIAEACDRFPDVGRLVLGIHLEGPSISGLDGYRGAHPLESVRGPDWDEFVELREASGDRIAIITLAPERPGAIDFIRRASSEGIVIALGHTSADTSTIRAAVEAGARLSTHLGNGIASPLPRHPNPIWDQAGEDGLMASLIADGHHLGPSILKSLVRAKTPERILLVGDASPLAGLPPGRYGNWEVDPSGKIVVAGTPYLAGSNQGIEVGVNQLIQFGGLTIRQAIDAATRHPARLLGRTEPSLEADSGANLIRFRLKSGVGVGNFTLEATCVDGEWSGTEMAGQ